MAIFGRGVGFNLLSSELRFTDGASTSLHFDETYAPVIYAGAALVKGLYVTEWTGAEVDGGINIQDGSSTTESSNTDYVVLDFSTGDIGTPANCSMNLQKAFSFSGGLPMATGLHISTTADLGANDVLKVRVLYEPIGAAGAAAGANRAAHQNPIIQRSEEIAFTDGASTTVQFDEAYSVVITDNPALLHSLVITEWTGAEINGGIRVQNGTATVIADNTDVINLDLSTGDVGTPANDSMNITKSWDFPGGIYFDSGLHIGTTADLGSNNVIKFRAIYERV